MAKSLALEFSALVDASPERVWAVLGDFGNEHRWARAVRHSVRDRERVEVGARRRCELAKPVFGQDHLEEELIALDPGRSLAYQVLGGMGPFASIRNEWRIRPDGGGTRVATRAHLEPRNAMLGLLVAPLALVYLRFSLRGVMQEFADYVESREAEA